MPNFFTSLMGRNMPGGMQAANTPPFVPPTGPGTWPTGGNIGLPSAGGQQAGGTNNNSGGINWTELAKYIIPGGLSVVGQLLQGRAVGQQNEARNQRVQMMDQLARDEMARKEFYATMILPSMLQHMGITDPGILSLVKQRVQALPGYGGSVQSGQQTYQLQPYAGMGTPAGNGPPDVQNAGGPDGTGWPTIPHE